ncbi:hypothetical protein DJ76_10335 [Halorubrum ezzemoulense]|uniref:Uncharacterized protein n=2 Tax=Halorubrum ezzemoulense TaxID=337243 RepID=A0A256JWN2_HALEZ|nr:hypothetical protein DJ76_10335 [Halorubrum ezzemoulense]
MRQVGQANVYFHKKNRLEDVKSDDWVAVGSLAHFPGRATYYELRNAPDGSDFDLIAYYYDHQINEIDGYTPENQEIGEIASQYGPDPVSIKLWEREEV